VPLPPSTAVRVELHLLEIAGEVARRGVALVRVLRKAALDDPANGCGKAWDERGERLGLLADDGREGLSRGRAVEGPLPRRELVENQSRGELVRAEIHGTARRLLGRHERRRADDDSRRGEKGRLRVSEQGIRQLGDSEVEDLQESVRRNHEVFRLEVPMDDADSVRAREPVHELRAEIHDAAHRQGTARQKLANGLPVDELHREVGHAGGMPDLIDRHDVRMIQRGGRARLLREPQKPFPIRQETGGQNFQGHIATEAAVARTVHLPHRSGSQRGEDLERTETRSDGEGHR
jgi:hypothetical protein